MDVATLGIKVDSSGAVQSLHQMEQQAERTTQATEKLAEGGEKLKGMLEKLGVALGTIELIHLANEAREVAERFEVMGAIVQQMAVTFGTTSEEVIETERALRAVGATMDDARNATVKLMNAHIELSYATKLQTEAQNLAVKENISEREAMDALILSVQTGMARTLRHAGVQVDFTKAVKDAALALGVQTDQLSTQQIEQIRLTAVIQGGAAIQGTYAAAIQTSAGQVILMHKAMADATLIAGQLFAELTEGAVVSASKHLQELAAYLKENPKTLIDIKNGIIALGDALGIMVGIWITWHTIVIALGAKLAVITAIETITAFVELAKAVGSAADAFALMELAAEAINPAALLAGVAALTAGIFAWKKMTQETKDEVKELDEKMNGLGETIKTAGGKVAHGTEGITSSLEALKRLAQMAREFPAVTAALISVGKAYEYGGVTAGVLAEQQAKLTEEIAKATEGLVGHDAVVAKTLVTNKQAAQIYSEQQKRLAELRQDLVPATDGLIKAGDAFIRNGTAIGTTTEAQNALTDAIAKGTKGMNEADAAVAASLIAQHALAQEYADQAKNLAAVRDASATAFREAGHQVQLAYSMGDAIERNNIHYDAQNKTLEANNHLLAAQAMAAGAARDAAIEAATEEVDSAKLVERTLLAALDIKNMKAPWIDLLDGISHGLQQFAVDLATKPADAFKDLVSTIKNLWAQLIADLAKMEIEKHILPKIASLFGIDSQGTGEDVEQSGVGKGVASGLLAFGTGVAIGSTTGNTTTGVLGGAASGAAMGAAAGPWGAAIGGLVGAAGGLFGAAAAHKAAAEEERKAAEAVRVSLAQMDVQAGTGTQVDSNVAQAKSQADKLFDAIDAALPGLKNQIEREKEMKQVRADEAIIVQKLIDADARERIAYAQTLQQRLLNAEGLTREAAALGVTIANQKDLDEAIAKYGKDSVLVSQLMDVQAAEAVARAKALAEETRATDVALKVRELYARGLTKEGDQMARIEAERKEIDDAVRAGWTEDEIAELKLVQSLEDQKKATDDAAAATERYTVSMASLTAQFLSLTGDVNGAATASLLEQQRVQTRDAKASGAQPDELALLGVVQLFERGQLVAQQAEAAQTTLLSASLKTQQAALSVAQTQLTALQQAAASLKTFSNSLNTGSLSALSPLDQLNAAKAQVDELYTKAKAGDAASASAFGGASQTYLQLAQAYFASTPGYVSAFNGVQKMATELGNQYADQASYQEQVVKAMTDQIALLQKQIDEMKDTNNIARDTRAAVIAELNKTQNDTLGPNGEMIDALDAVRTTLTGVGRDIVDGERSILIGDQNSAMAATQAEISAIQSGASAQTIATLDAVRVLNLQKTSTDDGFAKQIMSLGLIYGFDSQQVKEIQTLQAKYDQGVANQIATLLGLPPAIAEAMSKLKPGTPTLDPVGGGGSKLPYPTNPPVPTPTPTNNGSGSTTIYDPFTGYTFTLPAGQTSVTDIQGNWYDITSGWHQYVPPQGGGGDGRQEFAAGGDFNGGLRLVGELGPELEVTGPSRITSTNDLKSMLTSATGSNQEAANELRAQTRELRALVRQQGVGMNALAERLDTLNAQISKQTKQQSLSIDSSRVRRSS